MVNKEVLQKAITNTQNNLFDLSNDGPVLLVFLRDMGCVFCQEALSDLRNLKGHSRFSDVDVVFVHMANNKEAEIYFSEFGIDVDHHISDESCSLYEEFGLIKATTRELFSFQVMLKSAESSIVRGNWPKAKRIGDGFQMPGVFMISNGEVVNSFIHQKISDRPDYLQMIESL